MIHGGQCAIILGVSMAVLQMLYLLTAFTTESAEVRKAGGLELISYCVSMARGVGGFVWRHMYHGLEALTTILC